MDLPNSCPKAVFSKNYGELSFASGQDGQLANFASAGTKITMERNGQGSNELSSRSLAAVSCLAISPPLLFALRSLLLSVGNELSKRLAERSDCSLMNEVGVFV